MIAISIYSSYFTSSSHASLLSQTSQPFFQEQQRQAEHDQRLRHQQENEADERPQPLVINQDKLIRNETPCFVINEITLDNGNEPNVKPLKKVLKAANPPKDAALGKCLGIQAIYQVIDRMQSALIAYGYVTSRIQLSPNQNLTSGQLRVIITPGRLKYLIIQSNRKRHPAKWNIVPLYFNEQLNLRHLEQLLENLKRLPSVQATLKIAPSALKNAKAGDSDVIINWQQHSPWRLTLNLDDSGRRAIGRYQADATLAYDNPFNLNDLLYVSLKRDLNRGFSPLTQHPGINGYIGHYQLPLGYALLKLTTYFNHWSQTVPTQFNQYQYEGISYDTELQLSHLLHRGQAFKTSLLGTLAWRQTYQMVDQIKINLSQRNTLAWEMGIHHKHYFNRVTLDGSLSYRQIHNHSHQIIRINKAQLTLNFPFSLKVISKRQYAHYHASWQGQWSNQALNPEDQFIIGGRYTVRGFDGELNLAGDKGWLLRQELNMQLGAWPLQVFIGIDHGRTAGPSTQYQIGKQLTGTALGLRGTFKPINWEVFVGAPLKKPAGFNSSRFTTGFALNAVF